MKTPDFSCTSPRNLVRCVELFKAPSMGRLLLGIFVAAALSQAALGQTTVATDPVGFLSITIYGPASNGGTANTYLGLSFTQPVSYQATLTSASGTTLTDNNASDLSGFAPANGQCYVELITGSGTGRMSNITAASTHTITTADDLSSFVTAGTGYKIRKNWTLASLFGATDQAGLAGGTVVTADQVYVYSTSQNPPAYVFYYYKTSGFGGTGWRRGDLPTADQSNTPFLPTDGIAVVRHTAGNLNFSVAGAVKLGQTALPVVPGTNLLSNVYPSGNLTLGNSNLVGSGLTGGTVVTADQILIYNNSNSPPTYPGFDTYYYKTSGFGGTGWRSGSNPTADASGTAIPFGASIIIQRNNPGSFTWTVPQPF
jgi:uncharacterized protein (TIGR02597 family)